MIYSNYEDLMLLFSRRRMHEKDTPKTRIAHTKYVVCIPHTLCHSKYNHNFTTQSKFNVSIILQLP